MAAAGVLLVVTGAWLVLIGGPLWRPWMSFWTFMNGPGPQWYDGTRLGQMLVNGRARRAVTLAGTAAVVVGIVLLVIGGA
jgi:hypothetical protein